MTSVVAQNAQNAQKPYEFEPIDNVIPRDPNNPEQSHPDVDEKLKEFDKRIDAAITELRNIKKNGIEKYCVKRTTGARDITGFVDDTGEPRDWQDEDLKRVGELKKLLGPRGIQQDIHTAGLGKTDLGRKVWQKADRYGRFPLTGHGGEENKAEKKLYNARWADTDTTIPGWKKGIPKGGRKKRRRKSRKKKRKSRKKRKTKRRRKSRKKRTKRRRRR